ncbi:hypothetical protein BaRGS_00007233 [Batillaria attramentaria]|uniref:tRNA-splicing endonuclease subunit Sen54 N-terminal domain-containing protein n=1 Tax=Batillaria attramentaria TaxID=370345 RepID=A0ABD0LQY3_9CAEN
MVELNWLALAIQTWQPPWTGPCRSVASFVCGFDAFSAAEIMSETPQTVDVSQLSSKIFLSAQELFKWRKRENLSVPQRGGAKDFEPDGSWLQAKRLDAFYEEQRSVLAEPRVEKSGNLVKGTWNADLKLVNIEKTAKFWMKMGFADQHRNWLHPEEALFLMEVNCLDVSYDGLRLSLQEAYSLFLAPVTDVTVEEYQVYGHLRRLGYIVIRHAGKQSDCTTDCKSKRTFTSWDFDAINFPDIAGKDTVTVEVSCQDLLPPNTCLNEDFEDVCMFDVEDYKRQQQQQSSARQGKFDHDSGFGHLKDLQFSYAEWVQQHSKPVVAKNWGEWKTAMQERNQSSFLQSPVAHLWKGEVTPLVRPKDSVSTAALLEKLSIIKPFKGPCPANSAGNDVKIVFDVYLPNTTFRKTSPGIPDHRICVARGEEPPDFFQAQSATAHLEDDVPLHWAVVNCGEISFFIFENSSLPVHTSSLG